MALAVAALGVVEIATGPFDLAPGARLAGIVDDEGALGAGPQLIGLQDPPGQFAGEPPPVDVLAAQEIVEHAHVACQDLAPFGAEAVERPDLEQGPDQQGAEHVGQGFAVGAAFAAQGGAEQADQRVALDPLGQFGIGEDQGLGEGIGQGGIGAGGAAGLGGGGVWALGCRHRAVYLPTY